MYLANKIIKKNTKKPDGNTQPTIKIPGDCNLKNFSSKNTVY